MRNAFIIVCGLFTVLATWAIYRDSGPGLQDSRTKAPETEAGPHTISAQVKTRSGLEAIIETNRKRVEANVGDGEAAVRLADALMRMARVSADASLAIEAERVLRATLRHSSSDYMAQRMLSVLAMLGTPFAYKAKSM